MATRFNRLLQHHEELTNAGFAGTVGAKKERNRCHGNFASVLPNFEVLDSQFFEHAILPFSKGLMYFTNRGFGLAQGPVPTDDGACK